MTEDLKGFKKIQIGTLFMPLNLVILGDLLYLVLSVQW